MLNCLFSYTQGISGNYRKRGRYNIESNIGPVSLNELSFEVMTVPDFEIIYKDAGGSEIATMYVSIYFVNWLTHTFIFIFH